MHVCGAVILSDMNLKLNEDEFHDVKQAQEEGSTSKEIAQKLGLRLPAISVAMKYEDYDAYEAQWDDTKSEPIQPVIKKPTGTPDRSLSPAAQSVTRGLGDHKPTVVKHTQSLVDYIKSLWAMIHVLEWRRNMLENEIVEKEKYLEKIIAIIGKFDE